MIQIRLVPIFAALVFLISAAGIASAGLGVSGAFVEKEISPGGSISATMKVSLGESDSPTDIAVEVFGLGQDRNLMLLCLNASSDTPYSARPFLNASPSSFHLDPGKSEVVTLRGSIPADVGSGGRYAVVNIRSGSKGDQTVGVAVAINVPVKLTISNSEKRFKCEISNVSLQEPISAEKQKITFLLRNTGNIHLNGKLNVTIKDKNGLTAANTSARIDTILPTFAKLININIVPAAPLAPGQYNATVEAYYLNGTLLATKSVSFEIKS